MTKTIKTTISFVVLSSVFMMFGVSRAQELKLSNAKSWEVSGRVQLQHEMDAKADDNAAKTSRGFRIRRGRFQVKAKLSKFISTKFQIEVRDNSPKLKDAEGKLKLGGGTFLRLGQFKVPVWREELRSSSKLILVERSEAAEFLVDLNLASRHIGVEFGGKIGGKAKFAINYSNGAGAAGREDAGTTKSNFTNNGKMFSGRVTLPVNKKFEIGVSAALNQVGRRIATSDNTGSISVIAPDFGLNVDLGENTKVTIEGNFAMGTVDKDFLQTANSVSFRLFDFTGIWSLKLAQPNESLAGMDKIGFATGLYNIEPNTDFKNDEEAGFRFGPVFYFGKKSRLQVNGEFISYNDKQKDSDFKIRSQFTFNF